MRKFFIFIITVMILTTTNCGEGLKILLYESSRHNSPPELVSIEVTSGSSSIVDGRTVQFTATGTYTDGSTADITDQVIWDSSNTGVATISNVAGSEGLAAGEGEGTAVITATLGTISGSTLPGQFNVTPLLSISFSSNLNGDIEIYTMDSDGNNKIQLTDDIFENIAPNWSPDGNKIVFYSNSGGLYEIYTMDTDGNNLTPLTNNTYIDSLPVWSPDGNKIVFISDRDGNDEIYVMDYDGNNQINLTNDSGRDTNSRWSPDGSKIVFSSNRNGNYEIYTMDTDGNNLTRLTNNTYIDKLPDWSPDGTKIIFVSDIDGDEEIYVMNNNGTNPEKLTENPGGKYFSSPSCSPDGRIAFASDIDGNYEIYVMDNDGSNVTRLTNNSAFDFYPMWIR